MARHTRTLTDIGLGAWVLGFALGAAVAAGLMLVPIEPISRMLLAFFGGAAVAGLTATRPLWRPSAVAPAPARARTTRPPAVERRSFFSRLQRRIGPAKAKPAADPVPRLHAADRHPDAPARAPLRANRDLGSPILEPVAPPVAESEPAPPVDGAREPDSKGRDAGEIGNQPANEEPWREASETAPSQQTSAESKPEHPPFHPPRASEEPVGEQSLDRLLGRLERGIQAGGGQRVRRGDENELTAELAPRIALAHESERAQAHEQGGSPDEETCDIAPMPQMDEALKAALHSLARMRAVR